MRTSDAPCAPTMAAPGTAAGRRGCRCRDPRGTRERSGLAYPVIVSLRGGGPCFPRTQGPCQPPGLVERTLGPRQPAPAASRSGSEHALGGERSPQRRPGAEVVVDEPNARRFRRHSVVFGVPEHDRLVGLRADGRECAPDQVRIGLLPGCPAPSRRSRRPRRAARRCPRIASARLVCVLVTIARRKPFAPEIRQRVERLRVRRHVGEALGHHRVVRVANLLEGRLGVEDALVFDECLVRTPRRAARARWAARRTARPSC